MKQRGMELAAVRQRGAFVLMACLAAMGCMSEAPESEQPETGQVEAASSTFAWLRADGNTLDSNGVLSGAAWSNLGTSASPAYGAGDMHPSEAADQAFATSNVNGFITIPHQAFLNSASFSIELSFFPTAYFGWHSLANKMSASGNEYSLWLQPGAIGHVLKAVITNTSGQDVWLQSSIYPVQANTWHKVRLSYDAATGAVELWHNGVRQGTATLPGTRRTAANPLWLGETFQADDRFFGRIDDVRISNAFTIPPGTGTPPGNCTLPQITNGNFEESVCGFNRSGFASLHPGETCLTGWRVGGSGVDYYGSLGYLSSRSVDMNQMHPGSLATTFATTAGVRYTVQFAMAGNLDGLPLIKTLSVQASGNNSQSYSFNISGRSYSDMGWELKTYEFTATSSSTTLTFTSTTPEHFGPIVDAVRIISCG